MSTIYILWLRQFKRYLRSPARIIGSLGQPLLFLLALGYGFGSVYAKAGGGNYLQFIAPGVVAMSILFTAVFSGIEMIWDRQFGFLKETFVAPVGRLNIIFGRVLGSASVATLQGTIVLVLTHLFGFRLYNYWLLPAIILLMLLIGILFAAFGTALATVLQDMQGFQLIMNFLVMPMFFFSGSLFPLAGLPKPLAIIAKLDPMTYGVDALRALMLGAGHFSLSITLGILSGVTILLLGIASLLFSRMEL
ncbi:MAG: ABC transporter permease [Candidatus Magasanikbacteria bacterium]|nr:ABC transporter permease [Candidatus Magasanikbacteria bacterium]